MIRFLGLLGLFIPCVILDIKKKELPVWFILGFLITALVLNVVFRFVPLAEMFWGMGFGGLMIGASLVSRGAIGLGDGILIMAVGAFSGIVFASFVTLAGFICAAIFGAFFVMITKKGWKSTLPFAPFLAATSMVASGVLWIIE